jgi:hypothetical protein
LEVPEWTSSYNDALASIGELCVNYLNYGSKFNVVLLLLGRRHGTTFSMAEMC